MRVIGPDLVFQRPSGFVLQGEWYDAKVSALKFRTWDLVAGWQPPVGWKFFARYAKQDMRIPATANPLSWDTDQLSLSAVQPLRKALWLQYEYEINGEKPPAGIGKVKNNIFFIELFTGF